MSSNDVEVPNKYFILLNNLYVYMVNLVLFHRHCWSQKQLQNLQYCMVNFMAAIFPKTDETE